MEKVEMLCEIISSGLKADLTLSLDIDPKIGLARAKKTRAADRMEQEDIAFHTKIRLGFHQIHKKDPKRFHLLDAGAPPDEVLSQANHLIQSLI